ncbi:MAG: ribose-5-phosphate isomerase RpiA [Thermoleophilaceae bacterium]|nr:ribose-5-phosphate isomerase RpiA [Thermoleophilaceae bacterium]
MSDAADLARGAAAQAALAEIEPEMTIGLGSGRAVWRLVEEIGARWPDGAPLRVAAASIVTEERCRSVGIEPIELDGRTELALAIDGADEVAPGLALIKGGGGALLREKIVINAARRFIVIAEAAKRVAQLGERCRLPVEVVRFGWRDTARRLDRLVPGGELRVTGQGSPFATDEGHLIIDCPISHGTDPERLAAALSATTGVVEHGLFIGLAAVAYLGTADGAVETDVP